MISVVMSVYNEEYYLEEALNSILLQSYKEFELIIVNDGSTDDTISIIEKYKLKDSRIKSFNINKSGLPKALNYGVSKAKYDLIARMDADDICQPNRFYKQIDFLKKNPEIDILGTNAFLIDKKSNIIGETSIPLTDYDIKKRMKYSSPFVHPSIIIRRKAFELLGGYNEKLLLAQDFDLWQRALDLDFKFANLSEQLLRYRVNFTPPLKNIFKRFFVEINIHLKSMSLNGILFSFIVLLKNILVKLRIYKPKTIKNF